MRRPLLFGCICLAAFIAIWTYCFDAPPFYSELPVKEGEQITITGQIYQKEYQSYYGTDQINLYLKSIQIIYPDTGQVSKINPKYKIICEWEPDAEEPELGRYVQIRGTWQLFEHASNPGQFDFADYYGTQNIVGKMKNGSLKGQGEQYWPLREKLYKLRILLQGRLYQALPEKEASILSKMLLGVNAGLDKEVKELYQRNGIVHILSISGLHITILGMGVYKLLRRSSCPLMPAAIVGASFLLLYGCMTGFGISVCRAVGMYMIHMLGEVTGKSYDLLTATGVMLACMLVVQPRLIYHSGFMLSFTSVAGIGCLYPILPLQEAALKKKAVPPPVIIRFLLRRFGGLLQGLWGSASISIFTMPIMLYCFYEIPVYSPFVNLLVLPFMGVVMAAGIVLMILPHCTLLAVSEHIILNGYEKVCLLFERLPWHTWGTGRPELWQIGVYYAGILLIIWLCGKKSKWWSLGIVLCVIFLGADHRSNTEVTFLDVGQGDCIVVMTESGKNYMFDGGSGSEKNVGSEIICPFLKYHGITELDGIFISHPDEDHVSGVRDLIEQKLVKINTIYLPNVASECKKDYQEFLACVTEHEIVYYSVGDYVKTGDIKISCMHPVKNFSGETNTYSGCFLLEQKENGFKILLTGDVEGAGEELLTEQLREQEISQIHVLKVAHHGSKYATSKSFLKQADPMFAVISCGNKNAYGHPHEELLERLERYADRICVTKDTGAVTVIPKKEKVKVWKK